MPSSTPPYTITHVKLDSTPTMPQLAPPGLGNYVVFWWKEIALGQVFFESTQLITESVYYDAFAAAIAPAVQQYASRHEARQAPWQAWLAARDMDHLGQWLDSILSTSLPLSIPSQVAISVIICTRNRAPQLRRCLQQLRALACVPAEVVVVDNAPTDTSTRDVCQEFAEVVYVKEPRAGLDFARNSGVAATRYPLIAFVDDDVVVHPWLMYRVWETFQDPTVAAMTGLVIALELQAEAQILFERHWSFNRGYVATRYDLAYVQAAVNQAPAVWEIGAGANMAFRKSVFEEVGYFDELLGAGAAGCSDDSEMWYRILLSGHAIQYNPEAIVYHEHRKDLASLKSQLFYYMRGHVVAVLLQQAQQPQTGYAHYLYTKLASYYIELVQNNFPYYRGRARTVWVEIKGAVSGVAFYYRHRKRSHTSLRS
ncbi:glycosyltransferase [Hymenobacter setariae]|uniref:Glycosyltransferase n=1 Tax=Hymenobacter setariae TaxID=2594794 RepID=A0A558C1X5_9BACT|nr:glycosyltransferase [Hymenobacter setariae]TVT42810.1 glycosyltransferase [Hymenobacter setariae]